MVINFNDYVEARKMRRAALQAERLAERLRREKLESFLTDLLADLQAA